jgi:hypothetical protein
MALLLIYYRNSKNSISNTFRNLILGTSVNIEKAIVSTTTSIVECKMKSIKFALLFGFLIWLIPFVAAFIIYPFHDSNRPLFESIMPVVVTCSTILFSIIYLKKVTENIFKEGLFIGIFWFVISIIIDMIMFSYGPMKMGFVEYIHDIGITYLIIPAVTTGFGYILQKRA